MKIALLSDIHANLPALEAALGVARGQGAERIVVAGDVVGDGPFPVETIALLAAHDAVAVRGNVDRKVLKRGTKKEKLERDAGGKKQKANRAWTALQLAGCEEERGWLEDLPPELELEIGGAMVLVVHGSPRGDTDKIYPSLTPAGLRSKLEPRDAPPPRVLVCGHSHVPFAREVDGVLVVNCGSVGRPADGDPRGSLVLLDLSADEPRSSVLRFGYDVDRTVAEMEARGVPALDPEDYRLGVKS